MRVDGVPYLKVGDTFCYRFDNGLYGAIRIFSIAPSEKHVAEGCGYVTAYMSYEKPALGDIDLRRPLHRTYGSWAGRVCVTCVKDAPPADVMEFVGNIPRALCADPPLDGLLTFSWAAVYAVLRQWLSVYAPGTDIPPGAEWRMHERVESATGLETTRRNASGLGNADFWRLVACRSEPADHAAALEENLSKRPAMDIVAFGEYLAYYMFLLDGKEYADAANLTKSQVTEFADARAGVVAMGRAGYRAVLRNPLRFPHGRGHGQLLLVVPRAFRRATGREFEHTFTYDASTGANTLSW